MLTRYQIILLTAVWGIITMPRGNAQIKHTLWDTKEIYNIPSYKILSTDSAIGIIYKGLSYKGQAKNVYAFYASPGTLSGNRTDDKQLPAVVLVHGGGGTAFKNWAIMWAKKGYAAIAMDLRGNDFNKKHIAGGFDEPESGTPYFTITPNLNEQWMYQAIGDVLLAHNLIRSFKEVDSNRTALTGISWGGIISCALAGIDDRYKAVVPVYGCGYLFYNTAMCKDLAKLGKTDSATWVKQYDPSQYLKKAKMPILFVNGTNDSHFYLDSYAKTYSSVKNRSLSVKIGLKHNHSYGWANKEIFTFIDSYLNHTAPLPAMQAPKFSGNKITAIFKAAAPVDKAYLNYTTDASPLIKDKKWERIELKTENNKITLPGLPAGTNIWYLSVTDSRGMEVSGDLQWKTVINH
ncbi:dienelactone hydrolase [Pedobacter africanus]|uniref:Dienelactone hydrolase n=1 Tax=Pedobacter africanus TaxID=151894 RepID=A0ACC6KQW8_9SPHI|nr:alpha/beta fold hydrolase [Pedobacter africanus]MDR6781560.1 dienelactone hydrolase [Pedobacter africanus]